MRIDALPVGIDPPREVNVIIEVPVGGEPIKYEMDKDAGTLVVDRFLYTAMRYRSEERRVPVWARRPRGVNFISGGPVGGEPIKYEMDKDAGTLVVDRFLYTAMRYPGNYGFIPHTLSGDGDPDRK